MPALYTMPTAGAKIARAKALLKRDDTIRALDSLLSGLGEFNARATPDRARFEIEVLIQECVQELNRQPAMHSLFATLTKGKAGQVPYTPGQEKKLLAILGILHKALAGREAADKQFKRDEREKRKNALLQRGHDYLGADDLPRGKSSLRVLAEEFGEEPGILVRAGEMLLDAKCYFEAAEMMEQAIALFPKVSNAYGLATQIYTQLREYEKAETVYLLAIKQFGRHPRTLLNLAKLYVAWNKREDAFRLAQEAYGKDSSLAEAKLMMEKFL